MFRSALKYMRRKSGSYYVEILFMEPYGSPLYVIRLCPTNPKYRAYVDAGKDSIELARSRYLLIAVWLAFMCFQSLEEE